MVASPTLLIFVFFFVDYEAHYIPDILRKQWRMIDESNEMPRNMNITNDPIVNDFGKDRHSECTQVPPLCFFDGQAWEKSLSAQLQVHLPYFCTHIFTCSMKLLKREPLRLYPSVSIYLRRFVIQFLKPRENSIEQYRAMEGLRAYGEE